MIGRIDRHHTGILGKDTVGHSERCLDKLGRASEAIFGDRTECLVEDSEESLPEGLVRDWVEGLAWY